MIFAVALCASVLFIVLQFIGYIGAVQHPVNFGKFSFNKQRILCCSISFLFTVGIIVSYLVNPSLDILMLILPLSQFIVGAVYIAILNPLCRKKYLRNIADEIVRLNLDISDDVVVIRRKLMESSDISCSIKDVSLAIDLVRKSNQT